MQISQKCLILNSRSSSPYFTIQHRMLNPAASDILVKVVCFSVDPVMKFSLAGVRTYFHKVEPGDIFNCFGLGLVVQGNQDYETGSYVFGNVGTCDWNVLDQQRQRECFQVPAELVKMYGEAGFVYLINNGLAAYAGWDILKPGVGENVVVSTASGATGILLCQLLRKKGAKVIGLTSAHKFQILKKYADYTIDYKDTKSLTQFLQSNKFKYYFDNVGDTLLDLVLKHIEINGRIALCGAIENYSRYSQRGITNTMQIISKRLTLEGLTFMHMIPRIYEAFEDYKGVDLRIVKIGMQEFEHYFTQILKSGNDIIGKVIVQVKHKQ